jgi:pyridoxamine 5'-phosphate oxidase-like protein
MASFADLLVRELLDARHIASLATENPDGSIHVVAVWYRFDGTNIFVASSRAARASISLPPCRNERYPSQNPMVSQDGSKSRSA